MRSLLSLVAGVLALYGGCGVVGFALAQLVAMLVSQIIRSVVGIRVFHETIRGQWSTEEAKNLAKRGLGFLCTPIWQSVYFQGTTFVVRVVLGAEAVAVFNTIRTVCRSVNQIFTIVSGSITPELQCEYGSGNLSTVQRVFRRALHFVAFVAIIGVAALGIVGRPLYAWWTHNTLLVPNSMWYIFMSGILFNALWWTAGTIFQVTNRPYRFALYGIVSASVSTLLTYILSLFFGLSGAAMGYVVMDVLMFLLVIPTASSYLQLPLRELWMGKCTYKTSVNA
jgi:O-antigen/teichoic acid export membrane protein